MRVKDRLERGWPVVVEMSETLPGPPEVVWELITDWENLGDWMLEASDFVVTSEQRSGEGVVAEATIRIGGISTRDRVRVSGWDPPKRLKIDHLGWVAGTGEMHLTALPGDRTHLFWREELIPPQSLGGVGAVGLTAFRPLMRRIFERDLRILKGLTRARFTARTQGRP
ncbi:MAG TPA: SRPBCC family protein [Actinomycetota bacterium]|nr:SRPBCC family protein [Actinomycetota bacterium]